MSDIIIDFVQKDNTIIDFQQTQGLAGPTGPQGPTGATGPAGATTLIGLTDTLITNPINGQALVYDVNINKWVNSSISGGGGISWQLITSDQSLVGNNGYFTNGNSMVILTLPPTSITGLVVEISAYNSNGWRIGQNAGQKIFAGDLVTTVGTSGYIQGGTIGDTIQLICINNNEWKVTSIQGNLTII